MVQYLHFRILKFPLNIRWFGFTPLEVQDEPDKTLPGVAWDYF